MPQQFILRLFVGFECVNFERSPLLTFEPTTLRSILLVILFGGVMSASTVHFLVSVSPSFHARQNRLRHLQLMIGFWRVLTFIVDLSHKQHQCWCRANWIQVCLALLESDKLLFHTKGYPNKWSGHASPKIKSESSKSESNFFEWLCARVPFSYFWRGFYRTYGAIITTLIVHSCISCTDDHHHGEYNALIRQSTSSSQRELGNHLRLFLNDIFQLFLLILSYFFKDIKQIIIQIWKMIKNKMLYKYRKQLIIQIFLKHI